MLIWTDPFYSESLIREPAKQFTPEQIDEALRDLNLAEDKQDNDDATSQGRPLGHSNPPSPGNPSNDR